jgi:tight adherence protein C
VIDLVAAPFLLAGSVFCLILGMRGRADRVVFERVRTLCAASSSSTGSFGILRRLGRSRLARRLPGAYALTAELALVSTGNGTVEPETLLGLKLSLAMGVLALALTIGLIAPFSVVVAPLLALAGLQAPDFVLARMTRRRRARIDAQVPEFVELLLATTDAGLNPSLAFRRVAEVMRGPLGHELRAGARQLDLGLPWRTVLESLAARVDVSWIRRLVAALGRSQRLGVPVGSSLRAIEQELKSERRSRAEELARRAPVKMLFPLVFLILPAFLLLTVGPVLLATIRSLH